MQVFHRDWNYDTFHNEDIWMCSKNQLMSGDLYIYGMICSYIEFSKFINIVY